VCAGMEGLMTRPRHSFYVRRAEQNAALSAHTYILEDPSGGYRTALKEPYGALPRKSLFIHPRGWAGPPKEFRPSCGRRRRSFAGDVH
jgi:hypothetical protein